MLYEQWREVAAAHRSERALADLMDGQEWTFAQLADQAEGGAGENPVCYPSGTGPSFVISVLQAWRRGIPVCPLEPGQPSPDCGKIPSGIVHVKTTSATTGTARLIVFTADQLMADAGNIVTTMGLRPDWPNLGVISLAHSYGFSNLVLPLLLHGIPLFLLHSPLPEAMRRASQSGSDLTLPAVPALWKAWHEARSVPHNCRLAISAGASLPLPVEEGVFRETAVKIHNFYGASECGGIAYDRSDRPRKDPSLIGTAMDDVSLATMPDKCLQVRSAAVATGYWPSPDPRLGQGVYQTEDLVSLRKGKVYLQGRSGDQINVAGRKLAPQTVEHALQQCPGVEDCLVFGVPSPEAGRSDQIVACLVADSKTDWQVVSRYLQQVLPAWQIPKRWWFVDSLQANQRGKLSRAAWREKYRKRAKDN
jgi:acyl-CoA synthetase (AMP-forming)/AMP-acid ligase II